MSRRLGQQHQRSQIADFLCPDNGYRGKLVRLGQKPKDHMKENIIDMRHREMKLKMEREEAEEQQRSSTQYKKLSQFRDVSSRVFEDINENKRNMTEHTEFLGKGAHERRLEELSMRRRQERLELEEKMKYESRMVASEPSSPRKTEVPRAHEVAHLAPRSNTNFISKNKIKAQVSVPSNYHQHQQQQQYNRRDDGSDAGLHEEFGRVPKYLEDRRMRAEAELAEQRRRAPDPDCPPGMKLMPNEERVATLQKLHQNREEAMHQLSKMPFVVELPSAIKRKKELESKLKEIEGAIEIFSKPKVFIQM